jgi:hypothetical protein
MKSTMRFPARLSRAARLALSIGALSVVAACGVNKNPLFPPGGELALGTWGGDDAGVIVTDSLAHVHVGCTYGDMPGRVPLDSAGRFNVSGSYLLRAYPVAIGPTMPAQFAGLVEGSTLTLTVAVNDTVGHKLVALGPVTVVFGKEPRMGPCPICKTPHRSSRDDADR